MKPGQRTSEFWVVVLTAIAAGLGAAAGKLEGWIAAVVAGGGAAAYAISRGMAKSGEAAANAMAEAGAPPSERSTHKELRAQGGAPDVDPHLLPNLGGPTDPGSVEGP